MSNASGPTGSSDPAWRIAHDLKQAFGQLTASVESLPRYVDDSAPSRQALAELRWMLAHIDHLTTRLIDSFECDAVERQPIDLNGFIEGRHALWKRVIAPSVTLTIRLAPTSGAVLATESELEWVLLALIFNACARLASGGELTIGTGWLDRIPGATDVLETRAGRYVRLTVSDTGDTGEHDAEMGLLKPVAAQGADVDEPRQTVVSLVRRLNGWIILENEPRAGARVHVCLPCVPVTIGS